MTDIRHLITNEYQAISSQETIGNIRDFIIHLPFSHAPVVHDGVYIGNLATEDVHTFESSKKVHDYQYSLENFFVSEQMTWLDVLENFTRVDSNIMPVIDTNNHYKGYYEIDHLLKIFQETPFLQDHGETIVVQKKTNECSLSEINQIIETNNGKVLGLFVSKIEGNSTQVTIKWQPGKSNELIQAFRRYNYTIISEHLDDNYRKKLKENSDYLKKYLDL